jgi:hypothetical protein
MTLYGLTECKINELKQEIIGQHATPAVQYLLCFPVIFLCCCIRFRIPRTKQEIEADYVRKKITKKFQKHLRVIQNSEMDSMDLQRGTVQSCSDFGSRACAISTVGQEAHVLEIQDHRELMMMRSSPSPTHRLKRHILQYFLCYRTLHSSLVVLYIYI